MRTTLTIDDDVTELIEAASRRQHVSRKQIINDALRRALKPQVTPGEPYRLTPHESALRPGFDPSRLNQLADEMEDEAIVENSRRTS
ncbi:CopG family transcriptional regulator [Nocardia sp. NPDC019395]|uniref:ribbon-helix-helix domain-containing protein n=1 Tax=Nocardia sp. NPDC019395 TaxID=3154686 RepID=UPI0033C74C1B